MLAAICLLRPGHTNGIVIVTGALHTSYGSKACPGNVTSMEHGQQPSRSSPALFLAFSKASCV
eukprot:462093-Pelagomonas_calceolata.AAC.2